jgi:hypothetical protein
MIRCSRRWLAEERRHLGAYLVRMGGVDGAVARRARRHAAVRGHSCVVRLTGELPHLPPMLIQNPQRPRQPPSPGGGRGRRRGHTGVDVLRALDRLLIQNSGTALTAAGELAAECCVQLSHGRWGRQMTLVDQPPASRRDGAVPVWPGRPVAALRTTRGPDRSSGAGTPLECPAAPPLDCPQAHAATQ